MEINWFVEKLLDRARREGFEDAECYLSSGDSFEVSIHEGEIQSYDVSGSLGLGFRGLMGGKMGYAATQAFDDEALEQVIRGAATNARLIDSPDRQFLSEGGASYAAMDAFDPALEAVSAGEKIERALALDKMARSLDRRVTQLDGCALATSRSLVRIVNTKGLDVSFEDNGALMYLVPVAREGADANTYLKFVYSRAFSDLDVEPLSREAALEAVRGLGGASVKSGDYRVALSREAASSLLQTFAGSFSADAAQKGLSLLKGREGERIASECVTLIDDPLYRGAFSGMPFDGEGVPARRKAVIEDGALKTLLHNLKTAHKQGVTTTGNAARGSYSAQVSIAPSNFFIAPGARPAAALFQDMGGGLLITELMGLHAGANAVSGAFSLGAKGYVIEDGRVSRPVKGITVAGNFFDLLKGIEEVASDLWFSFPGVSSVGSPTLSVGTLKVAGA